MANAITPRGLSPVGTLTGAAWNEQGHLYAIANDGTNTYAIGDVVTVAGGSDDRGVPYATKYTGSGLPVGVVVGFRVADPSNTLQGTNLDLTQIYLPLNAGLRYAYVVDDPAVVFLVQGDATGVAHADVFSNADLTINADQTSLSTSSPLSDAVVDSGSILAAGSAGSLELPLQIIGFWQSEQNEEGPYAQVLVKWNQHQFLAPVGTA